MSGSALPAIDALHSRNAISKVPRAAGYRGSDFVLLTQPGHAPNPGFYANFGFGTETRLIQFRWSGSPVLMPWSWLGKGMAERLVHPLLGQLGSRRHTRGQDSPDCGLAQVARIRAVRKLHMRQNACLARPTPPSPFPFSRCNKGDRGSSAVHRRLTSPGTSPSGSQDRHRPSR